MPRRPATSIELTAWPQIEFPQLFGALGDERDIDHWESELKRTAPEVAVRISNLIAVGCDRRHLLRMLCELQASRRWNSFSKAELKACQEAIDRAARVTRALAASELRYHLLLARWNPARRPPAQLSGLLYGLATLARRIEALPLGTNRKDSLLRNELLGYVSGFVRWSTGKSHDEELDVIVPFLIGRNGRTDGKFSMKLWRRSHQPFCDVPERIEKAWARAARRGVIQEPIWKSRRPAADGSLAKWRP